MKCPGCGVIILKRIRERKVVVDKFCPDCGHALTQPLPEKIIIKMYLHGDKEEAYAAAENAGLPEDACKNFMYALYEVGFDIMVDTKTGNSEIVKVDGRAVLPKNGIPQ